MQQEAKGSTEYIAMIGMGSGAAKISLPTLPTFSNPPAVSYPGVLTRIFNQIARIKLSASYTDSIGKDLGIVGMMDASEHSVPQLTATVEPRKLSGTRPSVLLTGCLARRDLSCQQRAGAAPARRSNTARQPARRAIGCVADSPNG